MGKWQGEEEVEVEVEEEVGQRTQQAGERLQENNSLKGSACLLAHSLAHSLTHSLAHSVAPSRHFHFAPLREKECPIRSLCLLPVYSYSARSAHSPLSLSLFLFEALLQPDCISLFSLTFGVRSLARSLACPCVTFIIIPLPPFEFFSPHKGEVPQLATQ